MSDSDWFMREPEDDPLLALASKHGTPMEMLNKYRPRSTEELAEWLLIASRNLVDHEGLRILSPLKPFMAYQLARMMQIANLKVPK